MNGYQLTDVDNEYYGGYLPDYFRESVDLSGRFFFDLRARPEVCLTDKTT